MRLALLAILLAASDPALTRDEMRYFLETAKIVKSKPAGKGVTRPLRLTLSDGKLTRDAAFQSVDERKPIASFRDGDTESEFADSYHYNIAAFEIAVLLGLDDMVPVTVERDFRGKRGALSWWIDAKWDEGELRNENVKPADAGAWNRQMYKTRVFSEVVGDTDRGAGNTLITQDFKIFMIDFTRAFRTSSEIEHLADLHKCERTLWEKLQALNARAIEENVGEDLRAWEIEAMMDRRDVLVAHFKKLIAEKGESQVLY